MKEDDLITLEEIDHTTSSSIDPKKSWKSYFQFLKNPQFYKVLFLGQCKVFVPLFYSLPLILVI